MSYPQIREDLQKMIVLLEEDGWEHWAQFFRKAQRLLDQGQATECGRHILSGSGGMGSLNDVVLGQSHDEKGRFCWKDGYEEANRIYQELLGRLYEFSHYIQRASGKAKKRN